MDERTLGQVAREAYDATADFDDVAKSVIAAHEARKISVADTRIAALEAELAEALAALKGHPLWIELAEARKDSRRLDYLEMEMEYERRCIDHGAVPAKSLFRRNMPITRKDIDEAMGVKP